MIAPRTPSTLNKKGETGGHQQPIGPRCKRPVTALQPATNKKQEDCQLLCASEAQVWLFEGYPYGLS